MHLEVDALPGRDITGSVESVAPASGSVFSLLPPENATGNFTKIVQRVPVRIAVPAGVANQGLLRPGLSVVVSVDTRERADVPRPAAEPAGTEPEPAVSAEPPQATQAAAPPPQAPIERQTQAAAGPRPDRPADGPPVARKRAH